DPPPERSVYAERLGREAAAVAGRLAHLISTTPVAGEGALANGQAFLHAMAQAAGSSEELVHSAQETHPLDRLIQALALTALEIDLLLIAGMPHEHEGYASVMRSLNPRGEPYPSVGLAAQLFCRTVSERCALREVLELGKAVKCGALALSADAPFF